MITIGFRPRVVAAAFSFAAVLAASAVAPAAASAAPVGMPAAAPAAGMQAAATSAGMPAAARADACPIVKDKKKAATDRTVVLSRITPKPAWRVSCGTLYRSDNRGPDIIFPHGFSARDVKGGTYDVEDYVLLNQPSPYVSTSYDHDLYKNWASGFHYYIDAPGGLDVNKTIGDQHIYANEVEVAFPGGIKTEYIIGVCPVDKATKTEIMSDCESNPAYKPWH
ncbi:ADP-ribosyltransferase [Catenuloplanes japonicus]|uniref:ADP-ribosyltransferase n=1 Tax=Catenuloplanes japonicus TaxID=33876 RepID=UPI0005270FA5|nr:ADP-ribosyltransferase [Catenuloplanes japonicus]